MTLQQVIFGEPVGALTIPMISAGLTAGWKILTKPGRPTPADWDVGLELLVASLAVNLIFLGSPDPEHGALRLWFLVLCALGLFVVAVALRVAGHQASGGGSDGEKRYEIKKGAALLSSAVGVLVLIVSYWLNVNAEPLSWIIR